MATKLFISYAHADEDACDLLRQALRIHERSGEIEIAYDRNVQPGSPFAATIRQQIESARVVVFLLSGAFFDSNFCWDREVTWAQGAEEQHDTLILYVVVRECAWQETFFADLLGLSKDNEPVFGGPADENRAIEYVRKALIGVVRSLPDLPRGGPRVTPLASAGPGRAITQWELEDVGRRFLLPCPEPYAQQIIELKPDAHFAPAVVDLDGRPSLDRVAEVAGTSLHDVSEIIDEASCAEAKHCLGRLRGGKVWFNDEKFGILHAREDHRTGDKAEVTIELDLFVTDYFTHRVMRRVYRRLVDAGQSLRVDNVGHLNRYVPFLTSVGVNSFLLLRRPERTKLGLAKRSAGIVNMPTGAAIHVAMNKGFSVTDRACSGKPDLVRCAEHGFDKELGLAKEDVRRGELRFLDVFLVQPDFEVGVSALLALDHLDEAEVQEFCAAAQNAKLEREMAELLFVDASREVLLQFRRKRRKEMTPACLHVLKRTLAESRTWPAR